MVGEVESQRRAEPIRMRKEVSIEFLERGGWGSLNSCSGICPYVFTIAFMAACWVGSVTDSMSMPSAP